MTWVNVNGKREQQCPLCGVLLDPSARALDVHLLMHARLRGEGGIGAGEGAEPPRPAPTDAGPA